MQLNEFLEKFLPDYEKRYISFKKKEAEKGIQAGIILSFQLKNFPEALQNFANKLCEKQRENCVKAIEYGYDGYELRDCENAEQPKIEEL